MPKRDKWISYDGAAEEFLSGYISDEPRDEKSDKTAWRKNGLKIPDRNFTDEEIKMVDDMWGAKAS